MFTDKETDMTVIVIKCQTELMERCSLNQCSFCAFKYGRAVPVSGRGGRQISKIGVTDSVLCWELNPDSLEKQQLFLSTEPSVH